MTLFIYAWLTLTAYCPCEICTKKPIPDGITRTGVRAVEGLTVACDKAHLGRWVFIDGLGSRLCEDIGSGVKGPTRIDVFFESHQDAVEFGKQRRLGAFYAKAK